MKRPITKAKAQMLVDHLLTTETKRLLKCFRDRTEGENFSKADVNLAFALDLIEVTTNLLNNKQVTVLTASGKTVAKLL